MTILGQINDLKASLSAWWLDHLEMALPDNRLSAFADRRPMRLVVRTEDRAVSIALLNHANEEIFVEHSDWAYYTRALFDRCLAKAEGLAQPNSLAISLGLTHAIGRSLMIPRRARSQAEDIVRAHIRRKTPLRLDDIFLGYVVRMARDGRLEVRYLVAPQFLIERILHRLAIPAAQIATLENIPNGDTPSVIVPLAKSRRANARWGGRIAVGLLGVILASASFGFGNIVVRQALALRQIERDVAHLAPAEAPHANSPRATYAMADDLNRFAELRSVPGILRIWEDIATILPMSTYLTEVTISGYAVQISGFSASATALIQMIEGSSTVHGAVLTAPVIWVQSMEKERFSITASLRTPRLSTEERD